MEKKIVFIVGSLRRGSFNRALAEEAERILRGRAEVSYLEFADLPYMDQDKEYPAPESVARVRAQILAADGVWIFSPEYNHGIPGALKNLLDWLSRPLIPGQRETAAAAGKPAALSGAAGKSAASHALADLRALLSLMRMRVLPRETGVSLPAEAFAGGTYAPPEETLRALRLQADEFLRLIG